MREPFADLTAEQLRELARVIETGQSLEARRLRDIVPNELVHITGEDVKAGMSTGATSPHLAWTLRLLANERQARSASRNDIELVWTGPEDGPSGTRDTRVVVKELFRSAQSSLLIANYLTDKWGLAFDGLAARMDSEPRLRVRMCVNIKPPEKSDASDDPRAPDVVTTFASNFARYWPGKRHPEVFYDPRTIRKQGKFTISMHAKCVVADGQRALITSANFTEAAQLRNIETGVALCDRNVANLLIAQFENLIARGLLLPLHIPPR